MRKRTHQNRDYCYQARKKALKRLKRTEPAAQDDQVLPPPVEKKQEKTLPEIPLTIRPYQIAQELMITNLPVELREMIMLYYKSFGLQI